MPTSPKNPPLELSVGLVVDLGTEPVVLQEPQEETGTPNCARWVGFGQREGGDRALLFVDPNPPDQHPPGLTQPELCGWPAQQGTFQGWNTWIYDHNGVQALPEVLDELRDKGRALEYRLELARALSDRFAALHEAGLAIIHAAPEDFSFLSGSQTVAIFHTPETLLDAGKLPETSSTPATGISAPEVTGIVLRPLNLRADVYMLGVLIWSLIASVKIAPGFCAHLDKLPPLRTFVPGIPVGLDLCLRRAMARTPEARYESIAAFAQAIEEVLDQQLERNTRGQDLGLDILSASATHVGVSKVTKQTNNQDERLAIWDPKTSWGLFAVLDGVSRADIGGGDMASWIARQSLENQWNMRRESAIYGQRFEGGNPFPENFLGSMVQRAHHQVVDWTHTLLQSAGRGRVDMTPCTTLSVAALFGNRCVICAAGDSPIYLWRAGAKALEPLTIDHTLAIEAMRRGLSVSAAMKMYRASALSEALGQIQWESDNSPAELIPLCWSLRLKEGDVLVLTSDGIPDSLGADAEHVILDTLETHLATKPHTRGTLYEAACALIDEANARGGRDNLTALLVTVTEVQNPDAE